jgi:hypothetical protein
MTRRSLTLALATFTASALAACAESPTAPQRSQLAPAGASSKVLLNAGSCRTGWVSSDGRCS